VGEDVPEGFADADADVVAVGAGETVGAALGNFADGGVPVGPPHALTSNTNKQMTRRIRRR
jgi:hypothetical protein